MNPTTLFDTVKGLARIQSAWNHAPHELLSLWDMISFSVKQLTDALDEIVGHSMNAGLPEFAEETPTQEFKAEIRKLLARVEIICNQIELSQFKGRLYPFRDDVLTMYGCTYDTIETELRGLWHSIVNELADRKFVFIPPGKVKLFEQDSLFGNHFKTAFPSLSNDVKNAGNCLASELNTAAVFHLMRVMEFGLRLLHKKLCRAKPTNPNWSALLTQIDVAIDAKDKIKPRPKLWKKQRGFYIESARHFFFFKDRRNHAVHVELSVEDYDPPNNEQALRIFEEVKGFMQHLATKLKE